MRRCPSRAARALEGRTSSAVTWQLLAAGTSRGFVQGIGYTAIGSRRWASLAAVVGRAGGMPQITVLTTEDSADKAAKVADAGRSLGSAEVSTDEVQSYYWWEGKVNFDPEWRIAVNTSASFLDAKVALLKAHSYDLPMLIYDLESAADDHKYWKGSIQLVDQAAAVEVAKKLVERRVVACAQATSSGALAVKTVAACKSMVGDSTGEAVKWSPIGGNEEYLSWLENECVAARA
ncbi:unnamed protein product [Polarella glacialis]|uniref:Uncharacterized protein n=1 Tax=Polarella glacialis TaxID=89957 RepID=A0A813LIB8_POLGL|nr:unnamed protein product [Polarella glacialis]